MSTRLRSLDVFRGAAVALMILVNNPGSWNHLFGPLAHAPWHGCTPTDLVFPFFLFAVGNALALVMPQQQAGPDRAFWAKVARRTALIFAIGLFLNWSPFVRWDAAGALVPRSLEALRIMGVLQRIALAWGLAAVIVGLTGRRGALWTTALILLAYWAACLLFAQGADPYSLEGFFGTTLDRTLLTPAHLYKGEGVPFDPEGLASTLPAIAQVLLGYAVGDVVRRGPLNAELVVRLFITAVALGVLAYLWQLQMPLNKKLWTSSYVVWTTALATALLALLIQQVDRRSASEPVGRWVVFFELFGKNALFVFVLSGFLPRVLALLRWPDGTGPDGAAQFITPLPWLYRTLFEPIASDARIGSLAFAVANLLFYAALAWALDRRRIYIRV